MTKKLTRYLAVFALLIGAWSVPAQDASAVTINFQGLRGDGQGILGHAFVAAGDIPHMTGFYAGKTTGPYTRLASPDAFNAATGLEVAAGTSGGGFAATAPAPHGLAGLGIAGPLHISISGFTLDTSLAGGGLFFTSATDEHRTYRNGLATIFEETAPGVFNELASYTGGVFDIDIDYLTGSITNVFTGALEPGSLSIFPTMWSGTSFDPINEAGISALGPFGAFSVTTSMEVDTETEGAIPEPGAAALFALGLLGTGLVARRRISA